MEEMNIWCSLTLGDGIWAPTISAQIEKEFVAVFEAVGSPMEMAVFTRGESEGRLHCDVIAYFSPATQSIARMFDAEPCAKPARMGLVLLAGDSRSWSILFPEAKDLSK